VGASNPQLPTTNAHHSQFSTPKQFSISGEVESWDLGVGSGWALGIGMGIYERPFLGRLFPRANKTTVKSHEFPKLLRGTQLDI
jgi:hypothetical protein